MSDQLDTSGNVEALSGSGDDADAGVEVESSDEFDVTETGEDDEVTDTWVDVFIAMVFCRECAIIQALKCWVEISRQLLSPIEHAVSNTTDRNLLKSDTLTALNIFGDIISYGFSPHVFKINPDLK